jgi:ceramide glucosyltransferase
MSVSMFHHLSTLIGSCLGAVAAAYACFAIYAVLKGARRASDDALQGLRRAACTRSCPRPVSVLKPLCGEEPGLYQNLRSFCLQTHPQFQLLFGVREADDAAIAVVRRLREEFPALDLHLVIDPRVHGVNLKVSNLQNMLPHARHDWLVLADSDIGVSSDYLSRVTAPLADPAIGVITCLYRGVARGGLWSQLGRLFIDDWFAPSVQVSHALGSTRFAFGSTIALRRDALQAAGGFEALNNTLADDFWLGELTRQQGLRTVLSEVVVTTDVTEGSLASLWAHELRWMRTIRAAEPAGFAFTFITFTFPILAAGLALARTEMSLALAVIGAAARLVLHYLQRQWRLEAAPRYETMLVPLRDGMLLAVWAAAQLGSRVRWRNQVLKATAAPAPPLPTRQSPAPLSPLNAPLKSPTNPFTNPDSAS